MFIPTIVQICWFLTYFQAGGGEWEVEEKSFSFPTRNKRTTIERGRARRAKKGEEGRRRAEEGEDPSKAAPSALDVPKKSCGSKN